MEPELRPPPGTVPVERNGFLHYIEHGEAYTSLYDFISQVATPTPQARNNRLYGTQSSSADNTAIDGFINLWKSIEVVEPEMSLLQAATDCGSGSSYEAIEIGFQVNPALYDDNDLHLFTYFRTAGGATGPLIGGYNEVVSGFQRWTGATSFPGAKISASTLSAFDGPQYECEINVTLGSDGLWWLYACDNWLGFYPTQLANHPQVQPNEEIAFDFLHLGACGFQFFGEVVDTTPNNWTSADMGRAFPEQGYRRAAYIREPQYWDGSWHWMPNNPYRNTASGSGYDANCYRVSDVFPNGGTGWARWFYTGGPGGNSPGCT